MDHQDFTFMGRPAKLLVELDFGNGKKGTTEIGDLCRFVSASGGWGGASEIRIPIHGPIQKRMYDVDNRGRYAGW